jgi:hypothetical protein
MKPEDLKQKANTNTGRPKERQRGESNNKPKGNE